MKTMNIKRELKNSTYLKGVISPPEDEHEKCLADLILGKIDVLITQFRPTYKTEEEPKTLAPWFPGVVIQPGTYSQWEEVEEKDLFKTIVITSPYNSHNWKGQSAITDFINDCIKHRQGKAKTWGPFEVFSFKEKEPMLIAEIMHEAARQKHWEDALF